MKIDINTGIGSYTRCVESSKDLLNLVSEIINKFKVEDNDWKD